MNNLCVVPLTDKHFSDLNPVDLGWQKCEPGYSFGPYVRNYYLIHYVAEGCGTLYKKSKAYPVNKGDFFLIEPDEVTTYTADSKTPWQYIWVAFNGRLAKKFSTLENPVFSYSASTFIDMTEAEKLNNMREEFITSKLFELYCNVFKNNDRVSDYEERIYNYVNRNYMRDISVEKLASDIGLNRRYMSRIFKERTGFTVKEYITKVRMERASMLLESGYSVYQASIMTGYSDAFNFSKMFKKYYGKSPTELKNRTK